MSDTSIVKQNNMQYLPRETEQKKLLKSGDNDDALKCKAQDMQKSLQAKRDFLELAKGYLDVGEMSKKADEALKIIEDVLNEA